MTRSLVFALALTATPALSISGCGGDDDGTPTCDNAADDICPPGCAGDPDCADMDGGMRVDGGPGDNGVAGDEIFAGSCAAPLTCADGELETACTCSPPPRAAPSAMPTLFDLNRVGCSQLAAGGDVMRTPEDDFCEVGASDGTPAVSCLMRGGYAEATASETVTAYGVVDVFGNGGDANEITVEMYEEGPEGTLGALLGSAVATVDHPCSETEDEIDNDMVIGTRELGFFAIAGIPSETPLIVKTSGNGNFWRDIYAYNIQASAAELETGPPSSGDVDCDAALGEAAAGTRWKYRARILSSSDWTSIPLTAGLVEGVRNGSGALAGEIHDCDDIRLEFAQVATNPKAQVTSFFNENPDNPLPQPMRNEGTSLLGLYAALDIPEGPIDVSALGRLGGETITLGWYRARIFAGAVTTVTLRGLRPQQTP